ncbi:SufS family cysteine desulfurase [Candidatus Peribacteria bacterium]|nr:SufS family cysteine desulfurase [Candidatus Peribacteria bacterium]
MTSAFLRRTLHSPILNLDAIRRQFPLLNQQIEGHPLVYLDSAATAQKPQAVLDRMEKFYTEENANVHRGMHVLAERATVAYEGAREVVRTFINAAHPEEIIFTKSCTESINLVAKSWGRNNLHKDDVVLLSILEHHSNIVPWLQLKEEIGIKVKWVDIDDRGQFRLDHFIDIMDDGGVCLVAITAQSNVLGTRPPLKDIITKAHEHGAVVLVDAAQSISHGATDVRALDCDFLAFSGHKLYGPDGVGVLYGKRELLQAMPPFLGGGMMIKEVRSDAFTSADLPQKFEAGTPPISEAVGLGAAIEWLGQFSWKDIEAHEQALIAAAIIELRKVNGLQILGHPVGAQNFAPVHSGCIGFTIDGIHPHDLTDILGKKGICLRAGHHCTQPLHRALGITASTRLSVGIYNTLEEIRSVPAAITAAQSTLRSAFPLR